MVVHWYAPLMAGLRFAAFVLCCPTLAKVYQDYYNNSRQSIWSSFSGLVQFQEHLEQQLQYRLIHSRPCRIPCRVFIHKFFFEPLGLHLLVWSELGRSPHFQPMRALTLPWLGALSLVCEVALTLASPSPMHVNRLIWTSWVVYWQALTFWLFYKAFNIGNKAPYTIVFRSMALIGVERFTVLPSHCLQLSYGFFVVNLVRDLSSKHVAKCIRIPLAMAIPIYIGGYFAIDMVIRESRLFCIWKNRQKEVGHNEPESIAMGGRLWRWWMDNFKCVFVLGRGGSSNLHVPLFRKMCIDTSRWILGCTPEDKFSWPCKLSQRNFLYFRCDRRTTQTLYHYIYEIYENFPVCRQSMTGTLMSFLGVPVSLLKQMLASQLWWAGLEMVKYSWRLTRMWCECGKPNGQWSSPHKI